eukprot:GHVR01182203.1.p1 GENE.GHVR01182203.1~~GHVR01182203.1.p1  ORF type:complete len:124 (-),score=8.79 GHVR01182203.1:6018-6389(-)
MRDSRILEERYQESQKRLIPSFEKQSLEEGIRIIETDKISKLHLMDQYSVIDPENEKDQLPNLYSLNLFNISPIINTKYSLVAEIYFFFLRWEVEGLEYNHIFAEIGQYFNEFISDFKDIEFL